MPKSARLSTVMAIAVCATVACSVFLTSSQAQAADAKTEFTATFSPDQARANEFTTLSINIQVPSGYHYYSMTPIQDGPLYMRVKHDDPSIEPDGEWFGPKPHVEFDPNFKKTVEYYEGKVTYQRNFKVLSAPFGNKGIRLVIRGQICDEKQCIMVKEKMLVALSFADGNARPKFSMPAKLAGEEFGPDRKAPAAKTGASIASEKAANFDKMNLIAFLIMAFVAGLAALATPCVFPMIPITISFFSKFSKVSTRRSVSMATVYALTIIFVFTLAGGLLTAIMGAAGMQKIATTVFFNLFMVALLVVFAFNLFGLFEIRMPNWLITRTAQKEASLKSGDDGSFAHQAAGVFFMGVLFTLVSFTCTVGLLGLLLAMMAKGEWFYPVVGMLAFSTGFALPFFLLALFPSVAERMQGKGGDWMVAVKVMFGFIEFAAAFKFLSNLDLHYEWGIVTRPFVLSFWTGLFLLAGLYLLRVFALPHNDTSAKFIGPVRMFFALLMFALTALMFTGLGHTRPMGGWMDGWLPPVPYPGQEEEATGNGEPTHLSFMKDDIPGAMDRGKAENMPVFVDFTGFQCTNCRQMESSVFPRSVVRKRLEKMVRVSAYTDGPKEIHDQQRELQIKRFDTAALPFYAIIDPHTDTVLATFASMADSVEQYVTFLDKGLAAWEQVKPNTEAAPVETPPAQDNAAEDDAGTGDHADGGEDNHAEVSLALAAEGELVDFEFPDLKTGKKTKLSTLRGGWVFVNFWASWCAPCKKELMNDFPPALATAGHIKLLTVAFDGEETRDAAFKFADEAKLWEHITLQGGEDIEEAGLGEVFNVSESLPISYLISPKGHIAWMIKGSVHKEMLIELFAKTKSD